MSIIKLVLAAALATAACTVSGCYVEAEPPVVVADGYQPVYYDGYIVYYDTYGHPYYYANGVSVWVPPASPYYGLYVRHYRAYGPAYRVWYGGYGYRYRAYRYGPGYYGPHRGWR